MMRGATAGPEFAFVAWTPRDRASPLLSALFVVTAALVLMRCALVPLLLDQAINYTADTGSTIEKLHPTIYGFLLVGLIALFSFRITLSAWEVRVVRAMLAFVAGIVVILVVAAVAGGGGSTGFAIDTYAAACTATLLFLFPVPWRRKIGQALLLWFALSAVVATMEFGLKMRLMPFTETEFSFRPTGLANHPLELGLYTATALCFCTATDWTARTKFAVMTVLLIGLAASGARTALLTGLASTLLIVIVAVGGRALPRRRLERRLIVVCAAIVAVPFLFGLLYAAGALDRFESAGLADANARARVDVYRVFDYMSWQQVLFGMDPAGMRKIAKVYLNLEFIESPVVFFVTLFGALGTALFVALFGYLLRVLLIGAKPGVVLGTAVFFLIALSSNGLSTKGAGVFLLFTWIIALRPPPAAAWMPQRA